MHFTQLTIYCKYNVHKGTLYVSVQISSISVITLLRKTILYGITDRRVAADDDMIDMDESFYQYFW